MCQRVGTIDTYDPKVDRLFEQGNYLIKDIITGRRYGIPIKETRHPNPDKIKGVYSLDLCFDIETAWRDYWHTQAYETHRKLTKLDVGAFFDIGVGDGAAYYVVTMMRRLRCFVEWRGFSGDEWADHHFGYGGWFLNREIQGYCSFQPPIFGYEKVGAERSWEQLEAEGLVPKDVLESNQKMQVA
jgi:hypothetical protein